MAEPQDDVALSMKAALAHLRESYPDVDFLIAAVAGAGLDVRTHVEASDMRECVLSVVMGGVMDGRVTPADVAEAAEIGRRNREAATEAAGG